MYLEFEAFYKERLDRPAYDFDWNPQGFPSNDGTRSDISAHLPILEYFANLSGVNSITEFGVRDCNSTSAFINSGASVRGYDQTTNKDIEYLIELNRNGKLPGIFTFFNQSTLQGQINRTDILFVDTLHTYDQVKEELRLHAHNVDQYLIFHDTFSQWDRSLDKPGQEGIGRAISEYTAEGWKLIYSVDFNHGLQVYERVI